MKRMRRPVARRENNKQKNPQLFKSLREAKENLTGLIAVKQEEDG